MYMLKYVMKRLGLMLMTFAIIFVVCFVLIKLLPIVINLAPGQDRDLLESALKKRGYYDPIPVQLYNYVKRIIVDGDWGIGVNMPEFRNRLSKIVVFNSMDDNMAEKIVSKKLDEFWAILKKKIVTIVFTKKAREYIKNYGITNEYGARQVDRVINSEVKTLLVDELLYGSLRKGGKVRIDVENGRLKMETC